MKPEDRRRLKQHIEMIVEHKMPAHNVTFCPNCECDRETILYSEVLECTVCHETFEVVCGIKPSNSDVSVTQDVLMDIKKDLSDAEIEELGAQEAEKERQEMTPENELGIGAYYEVLQRYVCKNRVTKAKIKMVRIKYLVNGKDVGRGVYYLTCLDHNETRHCQNKTEALYQMRQPWVWCDGCAQIHFHAEWRNQLHHVA